MAARTILVELQPVLNTPLAKKLITIITFFGLPRNLEADLAKNEPGEFFANLEAPDAIRVIADASH